MGGLRNGYDGLITCNQLDLLKHKMALYRKQGHGLITGVMRCTIIRQIRLSALGPPERILLAPPCIINIRLDFPSSAVSYDIRYATSPELFWSWNHRGTRLVLLWILVKALKR